MLKYTNKAGKYIAVVKRPPNGWIGAAGEKKTPFIRIPLTITEAAETDTEDQIGTEIVWRGFITEAAVGRTVKTLTKAFGWNGDLKALADDQYLTDYDNRDFIALEKGKTTDTDPFAFKSCRITCEEEEHDGKQRVIVRWLNPASTEVAPPDHETIKSIVSAVAAIAKEAAKEAIEEQNEKSKTTKTTKEEPRRAEKTHDDEGDEIPF